MRIKVKIDDIEVEVDRPNFIDYHHSSTNGEEWRVNMLKDSVIPTLTQVINKAKELYELKHKDKL